MNKAELITIVDTIKGSFGNRFEMNEHTYRVWFDMLKAFPFQPLFDYVTGAALDLDFPPTLADLKRAAGETQSQRYHQMLRESAAKRFEDLEQWNEKSAPPTAEQRAKVKEIVNRRQSTT